MTKWDKDYLELCKKILTKGVESKNRTGVDTIKVGEHSFKFDLSNEFPILETKQLFSRQAITEILWIWQMGSNDVRELHKRNVHIWDEWMIDPDGIYRIYEPETKDYDPEKEVEVLDPLSVPIDDPFGDRHDFKSKKDLNGNVMKAKSLKEGKNIKMAKYYGPEYAYTIVTAYGFITNRYKHMLNILDSIKNNPNDRRRVKSLWQDEFLRTAVLPSCVWSTEWNVTGDKLNVQVHQRSCDVPLGLPFNVTQYAALVQLVAHFTNLEPGILSWSINDAHIYVNQIDGIKEQLNNGRILDQVNSLKLTKDELLHLKKELEQYKITNYEKKISAIDIITSDEKPSLWINPDIDDFFKIDNSIDLKDTKVKNYKHMGKIKFPISQ